jgi:hypothetical protein
MARSLSLPVVVFILAAAVAFPQAKAPPKITEDGLHLVEKRDVAVGWVRPDVNFKEFKKVVVPEFQVSFKEGWAVENRVSEQDAKRIREGFGDFYRNTFKDLLKKEAKLEVVDAEGDGVLMFKCSVVNMEMTAPENMDVGRSRNLMSSMGSAVLFVEVFDSGEGYIHARSVDPIRVIASGLRDFGGQQENGAEARRVFRANLKLLGLGKRK